MIKKLSVLFLALTFAFSAFAQERKTEIHEMKVPDANYAPVSSTTPNTLNKVSAIGENFILTGYDYAANNQIGLMVSLADIDGSDNMDAIFTAMKRPVGSTFRQTMFGYKAFGVIDALDAFGPTNTLAYGWGTLQLCEGGTFDGQAMLMAHKGGLTNWTTIDLVNLAVVTPIPTVTFGNNFPAFAYQDDGTIITTNTLAEMHISTDGGGTFSLFGKIGDGDPNVAMATALDLPSEMYLNRSDDGQYVASVAAYEGLALTGNPDVVYWYGSTDFGATWNGFVIGEGSGTNPTYGQVVNRPVYAPYFENFAQGNFAVDNGGVTHVVFNGYGEGVVVTDTVNLFPILYWNSNNAEWMEISIPAVAQEPNAIMADQRPGNGLGQAYPNVSVSDDGMVVFVAWTAPEYTGAVGASAINIYPGDGGAATAALFYTDLHWTLSVDGGATWTTPAVVGEPNISETYPAPSKRLELVANTSGGFDVYAHMLFFADDVPGTSLFATNNGASDNGAWQYYAPMVGTYTPVSVENEVVVNDFSLDQNYPNPFNPSTKIKYSVAEVSNVSIKVYDMLGKEVANLVNTQKAAGSHEVSFDASNLASGMYVYTITAGNFVSSKKMMLLK